MRVAMIDPSLFTLPYDDHLCGALFERGNSVTLFTRPLREEEPRLKFDYWKSECFYRVAEDTRLSVLPNSAKLLLKGVEHSVEMASLLRDLRNFRPDVIHFQWLPAPLLDRFYMPMLRRIAPTFLTVHDTKGFLNPSSKLQLAGWAELLAAFDRLIVHLETSKQELIDQGVPSDRIVVIPHGVLSYGEGDPPAPDESKDAREILVFGAIKPYKGTDVLIRAFAHLPEDMRNSTKIVVVGEPFQSLEVLRSLATELGVEERIEWDTRYVSNEEIPGIFNRTDVIAFPYRRIDASGVLMMALPFAKPIVATSVGCFAELLEDGETALLAPPEDPESFAAQLERVLRDPVLAAELGRKSKELATSGGTLSWDSIAARSEDVYMQVISERCTEEEEIEPSGLIAPLSQVGRQLEERASYDSRPVRWRGLIADDETSRDIGELSLFIAFADGKLERPERELIIDALTEMEEPTQERRAHARRRLLRMLENLDLTTENFHAVTGRLANSLDGPQKAFLVEVLFMIAISDSHLHSREKDMLKQTSVVLGVSGEKIELMIEGFNQCV